MRIICLLAFAFGLLALTACSSVAGEHSVSDNNAEWSGVLIPSEGYFGIDTAGPAGSHALYASQHYGGILRAALNGSPEWLLQPEDPELRDSLLGPVLCLAPEDSLLAAYSLGDNQGKTSLALSRINAAGDPVWSRLYAPPAGGGLYLERPGLARQTFRGQSFCAMLADNDNVPRQSGLALVSLDVQGRLLWDQILLLKDAQTDYSPPRLALDSHGNLYIAVSLDEGLLLCSFERSGRLRWARRMQARQEAASSLQLSAISIVEDKNPAVLVCGNTPPYLLPLSAQTWPSDYYRAGFALSASLDGELNWAVVETDTINLLAGIVVDSAGPSFISYFRAEDNGSTGLLAQRFDENGALASAWLRPGLQEVLPYIEESSALGNAAFFTVIRLQSDSEASVVPGSALEVLGPWQRFSAVRNQSAEAELLPAAFDNRPIGGSLSSAQFKFSKRTARLGAADEGAHCLTRLSMPPAD